MIDIDEVNKSIINKISQGYAFHKMLCNNFGKPTDYVFLQVSPEFEKIIGLKSINIIGKRASEIFPDDKDEFNLIDDYGNVAINGGTKQFIKYVKKTNNWYKVFVYSPERGFFVTLFSNISEEKQLLEEKEYLINFMNDIVIELDGDYTFINIWTTNENLLFKPKEDVLNKKVDEVFDVELAKYLLNSLKQASSTGKKVIIEYEIPLAGINKWFIAKILFLKNIFTESRYFVNISEITERKLAEKALKESERVLRELQKVAHIGSIEFDIPSQTWKGSPEIYEITGIDETFPHTVEGWNIMVHPEWRLKVSKYYWQVVAEKTKYDYEYKIIRVSDGEERWVHGLGDIEFDDQSNPVRLIVTVQDITKRRKAEEEIIYLSYHDKLTNLYNRRFYEEEVKRLDTKRNLPISIIIGDVNGLKFVNDAFGHDKGDELLRKAATLIQKACRSDDIVARWGGDEFVILLPKTDSTEAEKIVERIKESYSSEHVNALSISISFGWDTKRNVNEDILKVLKNAEDYMYKRKIVESKSMRGNIINTIIDSLHEKNPREEQHSIRVSDICQKIGKELGFSELQINKLKIIGLLHDIGKITIEEGILNKQGKLTDQEWSEIKSHPEIGYRILSSSFDMVELADCILAHHERWDGTGYPKGLKGEAIPIVARIIALADSYDAMTSERPYRKALKEEKIIQEIRKKAGKQFDPEIARIFVEKVLYKRWGQNEDVQ